MIDSDQLGDLLRRLAQLLEAAGEPHWARAMSQQAAAAAATVGTPARQDVVRRVLTFYGGMGSFTDVVLQDEQGALPEQGQLDDLRSQLFDLARDELA